MTTLYILEQDAKVNASLDSLVEGFDQMVLVLKYAEGFAVVSSDYHNEDNYLCIAIYSKGELVK